MVTEHETTWALGAARFGIVSNLILALVKAVAGIVGNSYALVADAIESSADVLASAVMYVGLRFAVKPADDNHPYGHGKAEPLLTFIVVAFLLISATVIAVQSIDNIQTIHEPPEAWTLVILFAIIAWKELSFRRILQASKETHSSALHAEAWHHRSDAITSVLAFIGIAIALISGDTFAVADDWAALLAALVLTYNAYAIFRPALGEIMDEHFYDDLIEDIRSVAAEVDGILGTEKCYIRKAGMRYHVDLHALVDSDISVRDGHDLSHALQDALCTALPQITQVLIHIEPFDADRAASPD